MIFYENMGAEIDRIKKCISRFGWTSDHNLDWYLDGITTEEAKPIFVEFDNGSGLLTHKYPDEWHIWSDPLSPKEVAADLISEFSTEVFKDQKIKTVWCIDVSGNIYSEIKKDSEVKLTGIYYSLFWPILDMNKHNSALPGGHFKDIRNARNKFYREHKVTVLNSADIAKNDLYQIVDALKNRVTKKRKEDVYDLKYRKAIENNFHGFLTSRVMIVDDRPVGFNAGYEVPNLPGRFAGVIGIHDYSLKDLGVILWLEDLEWIKKAGYKELDMQGSEDGSELKSKTQYGAVIERKTDTFSMATK